MSEISGRAALRLGALVGTAAGLLVLVVTLSAADRPYAPGELDLLLAARAIAGGNAPTLWMGAVHPDAPGTYFGALALAPGIWLGLNGWVVGKTLAALHFAILVGAAAGLAARLGGPTAGWFAGLGCMGIPALFAAHTKYLGTTSEVAALEMALLWAFVETTRRPSAPRWIGMGLLTGFGVAWSLHALWLAVWVPVAWALLVPEKRRWAWAWPPAAALLSVPFLTAQDPSAPPRPWLSVKSRPLSELPGFVDVADLVELASRLPWAALGDDRRTLAVRLLFVPILIAMLGALGWGLRRRGLLAALAVYILGAGVPLLVAGDLIGYPAGYRYFLPCFAPAVVLLAVGLTADRRGRLLGVALLLPGLGAPLLADTQELEAAGAAYFAAQHRLAYSQRLLHSHFVTLSPYVTDDEYPGWAQGYGVHVARDWSTHAEVLRIEYRDAMTIPGGRPPPAADRHAQRMNPTSWLSIADILGQERPRFFEGVGLGIAEDGLVDALEEALLDAVPTADLPATWAGIDAALGDRAFWLGGSESLRWEGAVRTGPARGPAKTTLERPLIYTSVGAEGRGERASTAAP